MSSTDTVNDKENLVSGIDASTCAGDNAYEILITRTELLTRIKCFGSTIINQFGKGGSLKFLTVNYHMIPTI